MDELEEPLIAMGLVENRLQITELIKQVDKNGNFEIDFNEFLAIIKKGNG